MLNSDAACSLLSNTNDVLRWMGTARAPVAGSGAAPACTASVSKPGSKGPGMSEGGGERRGGGGRSRAKAVLRAALWAILARHPRRGEPHEGQRHPTGQGRHPV